MILAAAGCGPAEPGGGRAAAVDERPLLLATPDGLAGVDARAGEVAFTSPGAAASPDGSVVARSVVRQDGDTRVLWLDPVDGHRTARVRIDGPASIRVVAPDGRVALGPPDVPAGTLAYPVPRRETALSVAETDGTVRTYRLEGNIEPEAFSTDGASVFVLRYTPAEDPTHYQVNRLDLDTGVISGVFGEDSRDERQERMGGTARTQAWAPDGSVIYTLYTRGTASGATSFIHVLDLDEGWAFCLDLPEPLGWAAPAAVTTSPDGRRLWATEASGRGAVIDTEALEVLTTGRFGPMGANGLAAVSDGRQLFLGSGDRIRVLDGDDFTPRAQWQTPRTIISLHVNATDRRLVAVTDGQLTTFPLQAPERRPAGRDLPYTRPIVVTGPALPAAECAC